MKRRQLLVLLSLITACLSGCMNNNGSKEHNDNSSNDYANLRFQYDFDDKYFKLYNSETLTFSSDFTFDIDYPTLDIKIGIPNTFLGKRIKGFYADSYVHCPFKEIFVDDGIESVSFVEGYCALESIRLPKTIKNIEMQGMRNLKNVLFADGVTEICQEGFSSCTYLTSVSIPSSVISIGRGAFESCGLTSVTIPSSVVSIGEGAFAACNLVSINIPSSVASIGESAFASNPLTNIIINEGVQSIGGWAFQFALVSSVVIPVSVTYIGSFVFSSCSSLTLIQFEGTIEQWNEINKEADWAQLSPISTIRCSDGDISL